jgi:hypothetical protein
MENEEFIVIQAKSIDEARRLLRAKVPDGQFVVCDKVVSEKKPKAFPGVGDTEESAFVNAEQNIPSNADVAEKKLLTQPEPYKVTVEAFDEEVAKKQAKAQISDTASIKGISLGQRGRRGFLGFGKTPSRYEIDVWQPAVAEITVSVPAVIEAHFLAESEAKPEIRNFYKTSYHKACDSARRTELDSVRVRPGQDPYMAGVMAVFGGAGRNRIVSQAKKNSERETMAKYNLTNSELTTILEEDQGKDQMDD